MAGWRDEAEVVPHPTQAARSWRDEAEVAEHPLKAKPESEWSMDDYYQMAIKAEKEGDAEESARLKGVINEHWSKMKTDQDYARAYAKQKEQVEQMGKLEQVYHGGKAGLENLVDLLKQRSLEMSPMMGPPEEDYGWITSLTGLEPDKGPGSMYAAQKERYPDISREEWIAQRAYSDPSESQRLMAGALGQESGLARAAEVAAPMALPGGAGARAGKMVGGATRTAAELAARKAGQEIAKRPGVSAGVATFAYTGEPITAGVAGVGASVVDKMTKKAAQERAFQKVASEYSDGIVPPPGTPGVFEKATEALQSKGRGGMAGQLVEEATEMVAPKVGSVAGATTGTATAAAVQTAPVVASQVGKERTKAQMKKDDAEFRRILDEAEARGGKDARASTDYILQQTNPNYRRWKEQFKSD